MARYEKKLTVVVEAFFLRENISPEVDFPDWWKDACNRGQIRLVNDEKGNFWYNIVTAKGIMEAIFGDYWIIRDVQGEIYPCQKEVFENIYKLVKEDSRDG